LLLFLLFLLHVALPVDLHAKHVVFMLRRGRKKVLLVVFLLLLLLPNVADGVCVHACAGSARHGLSVDRGAWKGSLDFGAKILVREKMENSKTGKKSFKKKLKKIYARKNFFLNKKKTLPAFFFVMGRRFFLSFFLKRVQNACREGGNGGNTKERPSGEETQHEQAGRYSINTQTSQLGREHIKVTFRSGHGEQERG
jgi:hypothetical protein